MPGMRKPSASRVILSVAVVIVGYLLLLPREAPLPAGAERLQLTTQPATLLPFPLGCQAALLAPVRFGRDGAVATFTSEVPGLPNERLTVAWPHAWSAILLGGRAFLLNTGGAVYAEEGDLIEESVGGGADEHGVFVVCSVAPRRTLEGLPSSRALG